MKKILVVFMCAATIISTAVPAFASGATNTIISPNPQKLFNPNCVSTKDNVISISTGSTKLNKESSSDALPNPLIYYSSLNEARIAVGFSFGVPTILPNGYRMKDIIVISNDLAEIFYKHGNNEILYRTAKGNADISGDYNVYDKIKTIIVGNTEVTVKGKGDSIKLATWTKDGVSFSLSFDKTVNKKVLSTIIESIK